MEPQNVSTLQIWDFHLKQYSRYAKDTIFLELRPEVKVTMIKKPYSTVYNPKIYPKTKFGISI